MPSTLQRMRRGEIWRLVITDVSSGERFELVFRVEKKGVFQIPANPSQVIYGVLADCGGVRVPLAASQLEEAERLSSAGQNDLPTQNWHK